MPASTSFDKLAGEVGREFLMRFVALERESDHFFVGFWRTGDEFSDPT